jgi:tubulin monoglycylase TTLL3/8
MLICIFGRFFSLSECYLRFCTQPFSLSNLHESVHLNNFAVQKNYPMVCPDDLPLPKDKMWDSETFKQYLE